MPVTTPAPPSQRKAEQALRLRRILLGGVSYLFTLALVAMLWHQGYVSLAVLGNYAAMVVLLNVLFIGALASGINLRLEDPSMTLPQICLAVFPAFYVMYYAGPARAVLLLLSTSTIIYGLFRFRRRDFLIMTAVLLGGYGTLIWMLRVYRPHEINLTVELMQFGAVAALLIQFSGLGSFIVGLRDKVQDKNAQLASRNGELETALARIEELAIRDELTGAYNRRHLMDIIQREKSRSLRAGADFSIFIIDVDFFKNVNDSYGHLAGDCVLKAIASTAAQALRQTDYFGRYGGEEFAAVVTDTTLEGALVTAERVRTRIEALRFPDIADSLRLTASIGIASGAGSEETSAIFKRADDALYVAKRTGRNRCILAEPAVAA